MGHVQLCPPHWPYAVWVGAQEEEVFVPPELVVVLLVVVVVVVVLELWTPSVLTQLVLSVSSVGQATTSYVALGLSTPFIQLNLKSHPGWSLVGSSEHWLSELTPP